MNISKNSKLKIKTKDGFIVKAGEIYYHAKYPCFIEKFRAKYWHDGKTTTNLDSKTDRYYIDIRGEGGRGIYPPNEDNPFCFILASETFKKFENAKKYLLKLQKQNIDAINKLEDEALKFKTKAYGF